MKGQRRIEQMYAFVALDPADNTEGIISFRDADGAPIPMVGADMKMVDKLRPMVVAAIASTHDLKVTLCRFEVRTDLEVIE